MRMYLLSVLLSLYVSLLTGANCQAQNLQRWFHPGFSSQGIDTLLNNDEQQYPTVLREGDVFQFFMEDVANLGFDEASRASLRARIALFKKYGTRISVEAIGLNAPDGWALDPSMTRYCLKPGIVCGTGPGQIGPVALGEESARTTLRKIKPIYDALGEVSYLALDQSAIGGTLINGGGPYYDSGCHFSLQDSLTALIAYMRAVHNGTGGYEGRPNIKIGVITNFPNVKYGGIASYHNEDNLNGLDFADILNTMNTRVRAEGETLWFVHADSPYNYTVPPIRKPDGALAPNQYDYLARLVSLQNQTRGLGLRSGVIFNTSHAYPPNWTDYDPQNTAASDQLYVDDTLNYIRQFRNVGGNPDNFIVESWYNTPYHTFPETQTNTFMNLVARIANPSFPDTFWGNDHRYSRQLDSDIFDWRFYLGTDPILQNYATASGQPREWAEWHWLNYGVNEARRASWLFSAPYYLGRYSDVAGVYGATNYPGAIDHYFLWGRNDGRLGRVSRMSGGLQHSIVQRQLHVLHASGQGLSGQLGTGGAYNTPSAVAAVSQFEVTDLASGPYNSLAVNDDGRVYAWGSNQYGQLGNGTTGSQANTATLVPNLTNVVIQTGDGRHIVSSNYGVCAAIDNPGQLWMWGVNSEGQLGDGTTNPHYIPKRVMVASKTALSGVVSVSAGSGHTVALRNDGTVWAWGNGQNGALGNGSTSTQLRPVQVMTMSGPLTNVTQVVSGGSRFSIALKQDGTIWGWGANGTGQLGLNDTTDRTRATFIPGVGGVDRIAAGAYHTICHSTDGHVYAWGYNGYGQLGNPSAGLVRMSPIQMREDNGMNNITDVAAGGYFSLMLRVTVQGVEKVFTVGDNQSGQLAVGDYVARNIPVQSLY